MSSSCFQRLCTVLVFLALTLPTFQLAWQGTGDINETVLAEVRSGINSGTITPSTSAASIDEIAQNISLRLNKLWDPAWNVVITKSVTNMDTIVYGYAFNGHWMWICGTFIPMTMGDSVDYIIWKDYNCQHWSTLSDLNMAGSGFSSGQITQINSYTFTKVNTDVWLEAHDFVEYVTARSQLNSGAYSVVMSEYGNANYYGHVCLVNNNFVVKKFAMMLSNGVYGSYFLFQTR